MCVIGMIANAITDINLAQSGVQVCGKFCMTFKGEFSDSLFSKFPIIALVQCGYRKY